MSSSSYRSVSADIEKMNWVLYWLGPYSTVHWIKWVAVVLFILCSVGCFVLFRGPAIQTIQDDKTAQLKIVFYRLTPKSETYSMTF